MKKKIMSSMLTLIVLFLLILSSTFAWIMINPKTKTDQTQLNTSNFNVQFQIEINKNNSEYQIITTKEQLQEYLSNYKPGDSFGFKVTITNISNNDVYCNISLSNILSINDNDDYYMSNVFCIKDGIVKVDGISSVLTPISNSATIVHEQVLNTYRLSNLSSNNSVTILENTQFITNQTRVIEFTIWYDSTTEDRNYQNGILSISSIQAVCG